MQSFNPELKVGMPAMVIGCAKPENRHVIGKMVTVEALFKQGDKVPAEFLSIHAGPTQAFLSDVAIVSGIHVNRALIENHAVINVKYLMPLPPLDDDVIIEATEKPKETVKC